MTIRLRILLIAALLLILVWMVRKVRKNKLDLKYTLSWMLLDVVLILLALFPGILSVVSGFFGIYDPVNMIFFCGFAFSLIIIYTLTAAVSKLSEEVRCLTQDIALMDYDTDHSKEGGVNQNETE